MRRQDWEGERGLKEGEIRRGEEEIEEEKEKQLPTADRGRN